MGRRDRQLEPVRVTQSEYARAPGHVSGLRVQSATELLDPVRDLVDALVRRNPYGKPLALDPVPSLGAVIQINRNADFPCFQCDTPQLSVPFNFPLDAESNNFVIPRQALLEIFHGRPRHGTGRDECGAGTP